MVEIPVDPGGYALFLNLTSAQAIQIGRLGRGSFFPGIYVYFGSARGSGGLRSRLGRHLRGGGKSHWHIDALRAVTEVIGFCYITDEQLISRSVSIECQWSQAIAALPNCTIPLNGFGASDCRAGCMAHLIFFWRGKVFEMDSFSGLLAEAIQVPKQAIISKTIS